MLTFLLWTIVAYLCSAGASGISAEMLKLAAKRERFGASVLWILCTTILYYISQLCRLTLAILWVVFLLQQVKVL